MRKVTDTKGGGYETVHFNCSKERYICMSSQLWVAADEVFVEESEGMRLAVSELSLSVCVTRLMHKLKGGR